MEHLIVNINLFFGRKRTGKQSIEQCPNLRGGGRRVMQKLIGEHLFCALA